MSATDSRTIGFLVGMRAEARLLQPLGSAAPIAVSGTTVQGAHDAVELLIRAGAQQLVSFGFAAGLDPALRPGDVLVPSRIVAWGRDFLPDLTLCARLGGVTPGGLLHSEVPVSTVAEKQALHAATGCVALDMETGALARASEMAGLPFAALRAICDPATRALSAAAGVALTPSGGIAWAPMLSSLLREPAQIPNLLALARDAAAARQALARRIPAIRL